MKHPTEIIRQIQNTQGKKAKVAILEENRDNYMLTRVLELAYNTTLNFYQTKITEPKKRSYEPNFNGKPDLEYACLFLQNYLAPREITGDKAKEALYNLAQALSDDDRQCLEWIIKRDVKAGFKQKTILSIWPGLFPYFPYMRCSTKGDESGTRISELKSDGIFSRWFVRGGFAGKSMEASTRNGTPLINIPEYTKGCMDKLPDSVYEGEMLILEDGKVLPRQVGNGIINACFIHGTRDLESNQTLKVNLWDILPEKDYWKGKCIIPRFNRLRTLEGYLNLVGGGVELTPYRIVKSKEEADEHYREMLALGLEGTITKSLDAIWKDGTSKDQIKKKVEEVVELRAVKLIPAKEGSRNEGTFGSILCRSEDRLLEVAAKGFTDKMRLEIFENWGYYEGKVMAVKSNGPLPPSKSNNLWSLFLPNFEEWRDKEKETADDLAYILSVFNYEEE
jgi:DNA ligase-1